MNKYNTSANRRRDIVTPAMRKAAEQRKLLAQKQADNQKILAEQKAKEEQARLAEAKRMETEARRRSSVKTPVSRSGAASAPHPHNVPPARSIPQRNGASAPAKPSPSHAGNSAAKRPVSAPSHMSSTESAARLTYKQQQQLLQKQKQLEQLEMQIKAEKERRAAESARQRRIRELEYRVDQQKLIRDELIAKDMRKDSPEKSRGRVIAAVSAIAILIIINIIVFAGITKRDVPSKNTTPATDNTTVNGNTQANVGDSLADAEGLTDSQRDKFTVTASDYVNGTLALINSEHPYDFNNVGTDIKDDELVTVAIEIENKTFKATNYKTYLNSEAMDMLNLMMADFNAYCGKDDVMVNSAHRTYEQQQEILDSKKEQLGEEQKIAQTPGSSEHHTGYAFDFAIYPANEFGSTFINNGDYTWIYENCHKYGFILRYPEGKTAITGIDPESWHFRYVGVPHATYMYTKGKTLEEYITDISIYSESIPLTITVSDNETYSVFYVKKGEDAKVTFSVPKDTEYRISGDNVGGFIVWYNNSDIGNRGKINSSADTQADAPENTVGNGTENNADSSIDHAE